MTDLNESKTEALSVHFDDPPVVETALSVQFSEMVAWQAIHLGLYYEVIRDRYPSFRQEGLLPPIVESFPIVPKVPQVQFANRPDPGRALFEAADAASLVQVQRNRFGFNWKQANDQLIYPHFAVNSNIFLDELKEFRNFCTVEGVGEINPTFAEVVYVNHIHPLDNEDMAQLFAAVFCGVSSTWEQNLLPSPEVMSLNRTYVLGNEEGRLYAEASVAIEPPAKQIVAFKLTSRMRHLEGDFVTTLQQAHDWLIKGFLSLTREECRHERWKQSHAK